MVLAGGAAGPESLLSPSAVGAFVFSEPLLRNHWKSACALGGDAMKYAQIGERYAAR